MSPSHLHGTEFLPYPLPSLFSFYPIAPNPHIAHQALFCALRIYISSFQGTHRQVSNPTLKLALRERRQGNLRTQRSKPGCVLRGWAYRGARRLERGEGRAVKGSQEEASGARSVTRQMAEAVVQADGPVGLDKLRSPAPPGGAAAVGVGRGLRLRLRAESFKSTSGACNELPR